jgi:hypothetical protein
MLSWRGVDDGIGFGNFFIPLLQDDSAIDLRAFAENDLDK